MVLYYNYSVVIYHIRTSSVHVWLLCDPPPVTGREVDQDNTAGPECVG